MINNRLFKKINSIFWCILTWLPIIVIIVTLYRSFTLSQDTDFSSFFASVLYGIADIFDPSSDNAFVTPIYYIFESFGNIFNIISDYSPFNIMLLTLSSWVCWVQVIRLLVYVFMWFIDLLTSLFDYLSFNRKGDN